MRGLLTEMDSFNTSVVDWTCRTRCGVSTRLPFARLGRSVQVWTTARGLVGLAFSSGVAEVCLRRYGRGRWAEGIKGGHDPLAKEIGLRTAFERAPSCPPRVPSWSRLIANGRTWVLSRRELRSLPVAVQFRAADNCVATDVRHGQIFDVGCRTFGKRPTL